ncbi:hypothetical protein [Homoserinibacter sp. GY 40078]|uniref:hypothetical protein n=1 Tax=Homoserinibacter sp. GY 40078 TaxID=2603275 RepID=UPI0011C9C6B9|nr:hypothetical protein [Homoserinibacter sp. GY 40078]TXK19413.1 hypothetical protein FVQ89_05805 [Homoserinibacter sp. GY 40078]
MSTEHESPSATRAAFVDAARMRRFRLGWVTTVVVLALAATGLGAAGAAQGPRLASGSVNAEAAVSRPAGRIVLDANQPIDDVAASDVTITPSAGFEVTQDGAAVTVRLTGMLDYAQDYTVEVAARSASTGAPGVLRFSFTTPGADVLALQRGAGADGGDRVVRTSLAGSAEVETVFEAPRIQEYALLGRVLVAVVLDADDTPSLVTVDTTNGLVGEVAVGEADGIREVHASPNALLVGFLVDRQTDEGLVSTLAVYDPTDGSGVIREIADADGVPLAARDWAFVPGTGSLVVQTTDRQLYLVDAVAGTEPSPLGSHSELRGFLPGTTTLVVADPDGGTLLDLAAGTSTPLELPTAEVDPHLTLGTVLMLGPDSYVQLLTDPYDSGAIPALSALVRVDAKGTSPLYAPATATSRIGRVCLSPNAQYLAVEVIPGGSGSDLYPAVPGYPDTTIYFVDARDGSTSRGVVGMLPDWC